MHRSQHLLIACAVFLGLFSAVDAGAGDLTFEERVRAQEAIERVYYSHQIGATIPFEAAVPRRILEAKVRESLRKSMALERDGESPVTERALALEVERMERQSRLPGRLREIFSALGNDRQLIMECLARPVVADRLARQHLASDLSRARAVCGDPEGWESLTVDLAPRPRDTHTAVWTGTHMIVWGGFSSDAAGGRLLDTGGRYDPATDTWAPTSTLNAPSGRYGHTAVWTGSRMIVWGGDGGGGVGYLRSGGRYDPISDTWSTTSTLGAPAARYYPTAIWTGKEMVVWGGSDSNLLFNSGGRYDPDTDTWTPTSTIGAPGGRWIHTAVWTGCRMIVWGGYGYFPNYQNTGGSYDPVADAWTSTSTTGAPAGRSGHTAVWAGNRMIIWGGSILESPGLTYLYFNTGGRYDPVADTWASTSTTGAPAARVGAESVWTGGEMIIWGGALSPPPDDAFFDSGGRYDPVADTWMPTSGIGMPAGRVNHTSVWTGSEMLVWGGWRGSGNFLNSGGAYVPGGGDDDGDGDGVGRCDGDCDDSDPTSRPGAPEACDGRDNDCNGRADDGVAPRTCGVGACERTIEGCLCGEYQICTPGEPSPEICNGIDDDCDGRTDEGAEVTDTDGDGIHDACENCPTVPNADQRNGDADARGDACDPCPHDPLDDADADGACGDVDDCADSDQRPTVVIGACETGAPNLFHHAGCTVQDLADRCAADAGNGKFARCVLRLTLDLQKNGLLTVNQRRQIQKCVK